MVRYSSCYGIIVLFLFVMLVDALGMFVHRPGDTVLKIQSVSQRRGKPGDRGREWLLHSNAHHARHFMRRHRPIASNSHARLFTIDDTRKTADMDIPETIDSRATYAGGLTWEDADAAENVAANENTATEASQGLMESDIAVESSESGNTATEAPQGSMESDSAVESIESETMPTESMEIDSAAESIESETMPTESMESDSAVESIESETMETDNSTVESIDSESMEADNSATFRRDSDTMHVDSETGHDMDSEVMDSISTHGDYVFI